MIRKFIQLDILVFSFLLIHFSGRSQEILLPACPSPQEIGYPKLPYPRLKSEILDTLDLPFFDDFSKDNGYPDQNLWTDIYVFINNSYAVDPISIGVATFDAIDGSGNLNGDSKLPFESDFLTSMPVNLNYPGRNDIYLSFFYQPQGSGDEPETWDSLTVEFYSPTLKEWKQVWAINGNPLDSFKQVFLPVNDTSFLHNGFRFRFKNYASLPLNPSFPYHNSNVDHWNIDYVYLDMNRSPSAYIVPDVSMISNLPSLMKSYEAMPWKHFIEAYWNEIKPSIKIAYRNNDTLTRNVTRFFQITDLTTGGDYLLPGGAVNVEKGMIDQFEFLYNYPFDFYNKDSPTFEVKSYLVTDEDDYKWNDTVTRYQIFKDYYAYDDGTAEFGYGLGGDGTLNAALAYKFKTAREDTLRAVKMYFNRTLNNTSQAYFLLALWNHDSENECPGELIYTMPGYKPEYYDELNKFVTYPFDTLLIVSEYFYVGWIQTSTVFLNVGFDRNTNNRSKIFYNLGQNWVNTSENGSLMIRPVLGKELSWPESKNDLLEHDIQIYPNPASDLIRISLQISPSNLPCVASIYTLQGSLVYQEQFTGDVIPVSHLSPGIYLLRFDFKYMKPITTKLLISR